MVPEDCLVEYCDALPREEVIRRFPELEGQDLVEVDHLCDLDTQGLSPFTDGAFDFVILNHVIEHVANPIQVIAELFRVTKPNGLIVISAPDKRFTFDRDRALTSFEHLEDEYERGVTEVTDEHYLDFLAKVHPEIMSKSEREIRAHVAVVRGRREHAHVWDSRSFGEFLECSFERLGIRPERVYASLGDANRFEYFSVWRKPSLAACC